jgi:hypothetical protein
MIKGTRTHEWGISPSDRQLGTPLIPQRISFSSFSIDKSSSASLDSSPEANYNTARSDDGDMLQLPLNTVLEIPDKISPRKKSSSKIMKKNLHRRAQIITTGSPILASEITLAPPIDIVPMFTDLGLNDNSQKAQDSDRRILKSIGEPLKGNADDRYDSESDSSEFSFEQDNGPGRNNSKRYYKDPAEVLREQRHVVREQGFYLNDYMDEEFDDEMNYFDEDDDFNDDEELFNKKYFSDDEELISKVNRIQQTLATNEGELEDTKKTSSQDGFTGALWKSTRSVKYHQLPVNLEQEFNSHRYSWMSGDESQGDPNGSYESLLDEINGVPDDYEYDNEISKKRQSPKTRSRSLNSSMKLHKFVREDVPQNTKFEAGEKTVTLFHRSNSQKSTSEMIKQFSYLTPNNSFTTPNPGFKTSNEVELSPISEGSYAEDSSSI